MWIYHNFFATQIRVSVSWSGSGFGPMIRIQLDPESKHAMQDSYRRIFGAPDLNYWIQVYQYLAYFAPYILWQNQPTQ